MEMRFVYAVGLRGGRFLMVFNPQRNGWEMPGGHMEEGETPEEAIRREFIEESGHEFLPRARMDQGDVAVFAGHLGERIVEGEMRWRMFSSLPEELAFPEVEYMEIVHWALDSMGGEG